MIYTVTLNPSIDYIIGVDKIKEGYVNRSSYEKILPGGKGINISWVLNNLGVNSCALGFIAGFTGIYIKEFLEAEGIDTDFIKIEEKVSRINVKIKSDKETEINAGGPEIKKKHIDMLLEKIRLIKDNDIVVLAGSVPPSLGKEFYKKIIIELCSKNVKIIVDAEKDLLINTLKYKPFLIKPNNYELGDIFNQVLEKEEDIINGAKELQKMGARNVLVSLGKKGGIMICEDGNIFKCDSPCGKLVNSTGAGDSVIAGFIEEFENSKDYKKAFLKGICAGSASAFSEELATKEEILCLYEKINLKDHQ